MPFAFRWGIKFGSWLYCWPLLQGTQRERRTVLPWSGIPHPLYPVSMWGGYHCVSHSSFACQSLLVLQSSLARLSKEDAKHTYSCYLPHSINSDWERGKTGTPALAALGEMMLGVHIGFHNSLHTSPPRTLPKPPPPPSPRHPRCWETESPLSYMYLHITCKLGHD